MYERESLIIFDEIQKFPKAREAIKYLVADGRYDFLETGSLISIRENIESITVPSEEVKSGKNYSTTSLDRFNEIYKKRINRMCIIHPKNMDIVDDIIKIPPYMFFAAF